RTRALAGRGPHQRLVVVYAYAAGFDMRLDREARGRARGPHPRLVVVVSDEADLDARLYLHTLPSCLSGGCCEIGTLAPLPTPLPVWGRTEAGGRDATHPSRPSPLAGEGAWALALSSTVASAMPAGPLRRGRRPGAAGRGAAGRSASGGQGRAHAAC